MSIPRNVRLSTEAHRLLAEKAHDYNTSMKNVASEAIFSLFREKSHDTKVIVACMIIGFALGVTCGYFVGVVM